jgi:hypothetical protein
MGITEEIIGDGYVGASNLGYVRRLWLLKQADVIEVPNPLSFFLLSGALPPLTVPISGIALRTGAAKATEIKFPPQKCMLTASSVRTDFGSCTKVQLRTEVPKIQVILSAFLTKHAETEFVGIVEDGNGKLYIAGDEENGLRFEVEKAMAAQNGNVITFTSMLPHPVWFCEGGSLAEQFPDAEFSYEFSLGFTS